MHEDRGFADTHARYCTQALFNFPSTLFTFHNRKGTKHKWKILTAIRTSYKQRIMTEEPIEPRHPHNNYPAPRLTKVQAISNKEPWTTSIAYTHWLMTSVTHPNKAYIEVICCFEKGCMRAYSHHHLWLVDAASLCHVVPACFHSCQDALCASTCHTATYTWVATRSTCRDKASNNYATGLAGFTMHSGQNSRCKKRGLSRWLFNSYMLIFFSTSHLIIDILSHCSRDSNIRGETLQQTMQPMCEMHEAAQKYEWLWPGLAIFQDCSDLGRWPLPPSMLAVIATTSVSILRTEGNISACIGFVISNRL